LRGTQLKPLKITAGSNMLYLFWLGRLSLVQMRSFGWEHMCPRRVGREGSLQDASAPRCWVAREQQWSRAGSPSMCWSWHQSVTLGWRCCNV